MADSVRLVEYFYVTTPDKSGEGAKVLQVLKDAGVNLLAFHAFPSARRAQLDLVPEDAGALKAAARQAKWKLVGPKRAILIEGEDRVGALAGHYAKLANAGINVTATSAIGAAGRFGAITWVDTPNVRKAAKALGAG